MAVRVTYFVFQAKTDFLVTVTCILVSLHCFYRNKDIVRNEVLLAAF
jgi:hypothetical protein